MARRRRRRRSRSGGRTRSGIGIDAQASGNLFGLTFDVDVDNSDAEREIKEVEQSLRELSRDARRTGREVSRSTGGGAVVPNQRAGGRRRRYLEFGAEGVRAGDLRLSRSGLSVSEKTFVGSTWLGVMAVGGQVLGHTVRAAADYDAAMKEGRYAPYEIPLPNSAKTLTVSPSAAYVTERGLGIVQRLVSQVGDIFGGTEVSAGMYWALDNYVARLAESLGFEHGPDGITLNQAIKRTQENKKAFDAVFDRHGLLTDARSKVWDRWKTQIQQEIKVAEDYQSIYKEATSLYGASQESQINLIRNMSEAFQRRLFEVEDVRGNKPFRKVILGDTEGR